ncbi:hypothetical protein FRB95_012897 [Tulasnella sp. JGI-2019a]|nr:hypothetical protein FRB95_012897 [Tulasnella sp. JGI-2019a]
MSNAKGTSGPSPLEYLEFGGRPHEDVSRFLGDIKRAAVIQGRHSDDEWMVSYAESCLRGDAMEWFDEMASDDAAMDWRTLRKAFLRRFHRRDSYLASSSPPPAAASSATETAVAAATEAARKVAAATAKKAVAVVAKKTEAATEAAAVATFKAEAATVMAMKAAASLRPIVQKGPNAPLPTSVSRAFRGTQVDAVVKILILGNSGA